MPTFIPQFLNSCFKCNCFLSLKEPEPTKSSIRFHHVNTLQSWYCLSRTFLTWFHLLIKLITLRPLFNFFTCTFSSTSTYVATRFYTGSNYQCEHITSTVQYLDIDITAVSVIFLDPFDLFHHVNTVQSWYFLSTRTFLTWFHLLIKLITLRTLFYCCTQCCGFKYIKFGSGSRILAQFGSGSRILAQFGSGSGSRKLLNTDPIRIRIHNTGFTFSST